MKPRPIFLHLLAWAGLIWVFLFFAGPQVTDLLMDTNGSLNWRPWVFSFVAGSLIHASALPSFVPSWKRWTDTFWETKRLSWPPVPFILWMILVGIPISLVDLAIVVGCAVLILTIYAKIIDFVPYLGILLVWLFVLLKWIRTCRHMGERSEPDDNLEKTQLRRKNWKRIFRFVLVLLILFLGGTIKLKLWLATSPEIFHP